MKNKLTIAIVIIVLSVLSSVHLSAQNNIDSSKIINVLTFNIYHGETMNHDFDLNKIVEIIKKTNPDFVALQEVDLKTNRVRKIDLATELAYRTKMLAVFGKAMNYNNGEYGDAILTKYSTIKTRKINLPYKQGYEPRVAVEATIVLPVGDTIIFVSTHLDYKKDNLVRISQARKLNNILLKNKYPVILAGDLNDIPGSETIDLFEENWTSSYKIDDLAPTFPSNEPERKIDYVMFYPKSKFKVIERKVINDKIASDHCAYLVTLKMN